MICGINRGKQFEDKLREQFEKLPNTLCLRLYDVTMGYKQINNPCDFIIYQYPNILYLECKAIHGNCLNFKSHIKESQWGGLITIAGKNIEGVHAGIICWFVDRDETRYIPIQDLQEMQNNGYKSYNIKKDKQGYIVWGKKKRVFFEYDLQELLDVID